MVTLKKTILTFFSNSLEKASILKDNKGKAGVYI